MKKFIPFFFLLSSVGVFSQTKIFIDANGKELKSDKNAVKYKIISPDSLSTKGGVSEMTYTLDGEIVSESHYYEKNVDPTKVKVKFFEGVKRNWYDNGQLKSEVNFSENQLNGDVNAYWKNGQLKRKDVFSKGKFIEGICYDSLGSVVEHYPFEKMPQYPGGDQMLFRYLSQNVRYPVEAQKYGIQGRVIVQFVVERDGSITDIEVVRSIDTSLDYEARRVIRNMPLWEPGIQDGEKVRVKYTMPVNFKLQ